MRPEQERVKNLLTDTVTLLCKNGLSFKRDLKIEALIGITLDSDDVFIVHINECFEPQSSGGEETDPELSNTTSNQQTPENTGKENNVIDLDSPPPQLKNTSLLDEKSDERLRHGSRNPAQSETKDNVIKIEDDEAVSFGDVVDTSTPVSLRSPGEVADRAALVAGQRRAPFKRSHTDPSSRAGYGGYINVGQQGLWGEGEPPAKITLTEEYYASPAEGDVSGQFLYNPGGGGSGSGRSSQLMTHEGQTEQAGCSNWTLASTPSKSSLPTDVMAILGGSSEARYPTLSGLQNHTHRSLLASHIVDPILSVSGQMCAFRLSWYGKAGLGDLDSAWNDITAYQQHCDQVVTNFPGIAVVASAFTGTVSGLKKGEPGGGRRTYPGISYFVVPGTTDFVYPNLLACMEQNNMGAVMKPILGFHEQTRAKLCSALYLVFKDNVDTGYVQRMVDQSAASHGEGGQEGGGHFPMLRKSVSSEAKFPNFALVNYHAKEPLMKYLVAPVQAQGGVVTAFRLGWFGKAGENLEEVWEQQVFLRTAVDAQVCDTPGVAFVVSALSGTVSQKAGYPRKTYPAVAYWIASQDGTFLESDILPRMQTLTLGSTVKQLHNTTNPDPHKMAASLYVVVKDNSESYVRRRADASAAIYEGTCGERHPLVKVFIKDPRYLCVLEEAKGELEKVNFPIHLEKVFD